MPDSSEVKNETPPEVALVKNEGSRVKPPASGSISRSPNYPVTDLEDAVERIKKVYKAIRFGTQNYDFVAKSMGYKGLSGASRVMIATLKRYGFIEDTGKDALRITEDAKAIVMLATSDPRYIEAVKQSAFKPQVFVDLYEIYGFDLPDDASLQFFLANRKFGPEAAIEAARSFRRTVEFLLKLDPDVQMPVEKGDNEAPASNFNMPSDTQKQQTPAPRANEQRTAPQTNSNPQPSFAAAPVSAVDASLEIHAKLFGDCKGHIRIEGAVTKKSIEKLGRILAAYAEDYEDEEPKLTPVSKPKKIQPAPQVDEEETLDLYEGEDEEDEE